MRFALLAALAFAAACSQQPAGPEEAAAETAAFDQAAAEAELLAWARQTYNGDGMGLIEPINSFFGDFTGDGAPDALAVAYYDMGGSGAGIGMALFRNEAGHMVFQRTVDDVYGQEPREVSFTPGQITLTTSMPGPNDPHCCPSQPTQWTITTN